MLPVADVHDPHDVKRLWAERHQAVFVSYLASFAIVFLGYSKCENCANFELALRSCHSVAP